MFKPLFYLQNISTFWGRPISNELVQELRDNGYTLREIGEYYSITKQSIWCRCNRDKVNAFKRKPYYRNYQKLYMRDYRAKKKEQV